MIIKVKGNPSTKFETTATSFKEITDYHPAIFTRQKVKNILKQLTSEKLNISTKCGECELQHYYEVSKTDKGNLQIGCSVMAKKDVQRLRKWANRK